MLKAEIKDIDVIGEELISLAPEEKDCFSFQATIAIGVANEIGSDYFHLKICTPKWLEKVCRKKDIWANNMLIVPTWDPEDIEDTIRRKVESMSAETWDKLAVKISRFAWWEFEDYSDVHLKDTCSEE